MKKGYVYIITNYTKKTLYIGVTTNLKERIEQHQNEIGSEFTKKYKCKYLLYYEEYECYNDAIEREKKLKNWKREWKLELIKKVNSEMKFLNSEMM